MTIKGFTDRGAEIAARRAARTTEDQAFIDNMRAQAADADRAYRMQLAAIREAGHLTQTELARRLGKPKGNVSRTEHAGDMLYSTLLAYLEAAGASNVALTATIGGRRVEVELAAV